MGIFITKLYQFRRNAKKKIIMEEEAAVRASLNHRDAFILDMGKKLYTVNVDESRALVVKEVGRGELSKSMLDTTAIMMLDNRVEVFMWCGKEASGIESRSAMPTAVNFLKTNNRNPDTTAIHIIKEGKAGKNKIWAKTFAN